MNKLFFLFVLLLIVYFYFRSNTKINVNTPPNQTEIQTLQYIDKEQFMIAVKRFVPDVTSRTLNRIIMLTLMGPIFGWFLLSSFLLNVSTHENDNQKDIKQLFYKPLV